MGLTYSWGSALEPAGGGGGGGGLVALTRTPPDAATYEQPEVTAGGLLCTMTPLFINLGYGA